MASQQAADATAPSATAVASGEAPPSDASSTLAQNATAAATAATDLEKKMRRAERFGTLVVMSEEEKRSSRAER
jgi:SAP domain-containing ribonucleoprotein